MGWKEVFHANRNWRKPGYQLLYETKIKENFYWGIVDIQCCASLRCKAKWISYTYTYIHCFLDLFLYRLSYRVMSRVFCAIKSVQFSCSRCVTLCDSINCSMPGLTVCHHLPEFTQTHVHWVSDAIQPLHPLSSPSSYLNSFPASGSFQRSQLLASGGQRIGVSASASVLPMNIQDWSPSGWTGWISLQSKGLSRVFSNTTVQKHQFFGAQLSL